MGFKRAMLYYYKNDDVDVTCLQHMLLSVGKANGLRGVVRQLEFGGNRYFVVIEGWDYHVDRFLTFLDLSQAGLGTYNRVRKVAVPSFGDMRFPDRFIYVRAKRDCERKAKPVPGKN